MMKPTKPKQKGTGESGKNRSFSAQLHKMHPNEVGALLMRIDAKISSDPNNPKPFFDKGLALMKLKMFREAVEAFKKSIDINPDNPAVHFQIANAFLETGQLQLARKGYEKSIGFQHTLLKDLPNNIEKMIAGDIKYDDNLDNLRKITNIIDLSGSLETNDKKDLKKIDFFLNNLKELNAQN